MNMTIEIKQLVVRAVVEPRRAPPGDAPAPRACGAAGAPGRAAPDAAPDPTVDRESLVADCARQVLRELRRGRER